MAMVLLDGLARRYGVTPTAALELTSFDLYAANAGALYESRKAQFGH